jgi:hypothetical protein
VVSIRASVLCLKKQILNSEAKKADKLLKETPKLPNRRRVGRWMK